MVEIASVELTHPDKLIFPDAGITKLDLARYYETVSNALLSRLQHRPLTFRVFPRGIEAPGFYRKHAPDSRPDWVRIWCDVAESTGETVDFIICDDLRTLIWLVQNNVIELHPWLSTVDHPDCPDVAVFDLDPDDGAPFSTAAEAALVVKEALDARGIPSWPKLTGSSGIHILIPLQPERDFDHVRAWIHSIAEELAGSHPDLITTALARGERRGRVLLDYAQNSRGRNTLAAYSARARPGAPVSAPINWNELKSRSVRSDTWTIKTMPERLRKVGDLGPPLDVTGYRPS